MIWRHNFSDESKIILQFLIIVNTYSSDAAYKWVKNYVGASLSRDSIDSRIIDGMVKNKGSIIDSQDDVGGLPDIKSVKGEVDTDCDGIDEDCDGFDAKQEPIPDWIRNNAEWWAAEQIDDDTFIQGLEFLIKRGIINV